MRGLLSARSESAELAGVFRFIGLRVALGGEYSWHSTDA